ncbi:MAG TPA: FN3 domain-containing metallophosphoesterase family protein, partial [Spirochaetia bacterium]|nr:FN3 domain-containing metallophosphoesterase family protein [Spirochaetia bacterium]
MKARLIVLALALTALLSCVTAPTGIVPAPVISWPGDPGTSIAVSWWTGGGDAALDLRRPDGTTTTIEAATDRGFATAEVDGLQPDTGYSYRVAGGTWQDFATMPNDTSPLAFAVIGDLQPFNSEIDRTTSLVMRKVASLGPSFALQIGDVAEVGISSSSWRRAISILSLLGSETPLLMTAGNHDYYYGLPSARYFKTIFPAPYEEQQSLR